MNVLEVVNKSSPLGSLLQVKTPAFRMPPGKEVLLKILQAILNSKRRIIFDFLNLQNNKFKIHFLPLHLNAVARHFLYKQKLTSSAQDRLLAEFRLLFE